MTNHNHPTVFSSKEVVNNNFQQQYILLLQLTRRKDRIWLFPHPSNQVSSNIKTSTNSTFPIISITSEYPKRNIGLFSIEQTKINSPTNIFNYPFNNN